MIFAKGHGTQNDFVLLPDLDAKLTLTPAVVAALCDRRRGLGADGVLRVTTAGALLAAGALDRVPDGVTADDWYMDYRNADGSTAQMCGNGARVFAHYLRASGVESRNEFVVGSLAGPRPVVLHRVDATNADVSVDMGKVNTLGEGQAVVGGRTFSGLAVDVGNPHLACVDPELTVEALAALDVAAPVTFDKAQFPDGVNIEVLTFPADRAVTCECTSVASGKPGPAAPEPSPPPLPGCRTPERPAALSPYGFRAVTSSSPSPRPPATCGARRCLVARGELSEEWWQAAQR